MSQLKEEVLSITEEVKNTFGELSIEKIYLRPNAETWSIAENLEHLIKVNSSYYPIFDKLKAGTFQAAFVSRISFFPRIIGDMILKSVKLSNSKKIKTFPLWEPKINKEQQEDIIKKFEKHQKELCNKIEEMSPFVEKGIIISSPANKVIVYSLEKAFEIIITHEKRHLEQAKRAFAQINRDHEVIS